MPLPPALRSRDFRLLVGGLTVSAVGIAMTPVALAFAVIELGGSTTELGLVVAAFATAEVLTLLCGGVLGDRVSRRLLMQGSAAATAVTQAACAAILVTGHGEIWVLAGIGVLNGCLGALGHPSSQAMTRLTVPMEHLPNAVAVRRLATQVAQVTGYAAAGMIVAALGPGWAIAVDAATYAGAACCFAAIRVGAATRVGTGSVLADLGDGAREVLRHTWLWLLIGQAMIYHLCYGGVQGALGPVVVGREWGPSAWGWSLAALMGGFLVGGLVSLVWRPRFGLRIGVVLLSLTAAFPLAMATTDRLSLLLVGAALHGFGLELFSVNWDLSIQQNIPEEKLARVYSFDLVGSFVCRPVGLALTGPVAVVVGERAWLLVVAAIMALSSFGALAAPSVRRLQRLAPVDAAPQGVG